MPTMDINFSRSASQIIGQYYNFARFGFEGYRLIHEKTRKIAMYIAEELEQLDIFQIYNAGEEMPIICWTLKVDADKKWNLYDLADRIRMNGWQVPAYPLPADMEDTVIQRAVIRADFTRQLARHFVEDFKRCVKELDEARILPGGKEQDCGVYGFTH